MSGLLHTNYTVWITSGVCAFTRSWKLIWKAESNLKFMFTTPFVKCVCEQLASPSSSSSSSSESQPVRTEIYQLGRKVIMLHAGFVFVRFYFEYEGAGWPSALPKKYALPEAIAQENKHKRLRTVWRHLISIYFVLLNYSGVFFILAVSSAGFLSAKHPALNCKV